MTDERGRGAEPPDGRGAGGGERRGAGRPGRIRRVILRPLAWTLLSLAVLVAALSLYLDSAAAAERLRAFLAARLSEALGRPVALGAARIDLFPPAVEVSDLVIPGPSPQDPPLAVLPAGRLEVTVEGLRRPRVRLSRAWLHRPRFYLAFDAEGRPNLPALPRAGGGERRLTLEIGSLLVEDGTFALDHLEVPLSLAARGVSVSAAGRGAGLEVEGRLAADEVELVLPGARPYRLEVEGRARVGRGEVEILAGRFAGADLAASVAGAYTWRDGQRRLGLDLEADGRAEVLTRLGYTDGWVSGPVRYRGRLDVSGKEWILEGEVASERLVLSDRVLSGVEAGVVARPGALTADLRRAGYLGGSVAGEIRVGLGRAPVPVAAELAVEGIGVRPFFAELGIPIAGIAGRAGGSVSYRFLSNRPLAGDGWAELAVAGPDGESGQIPLSGEVALTIGGGVLASEAIRLRSPSQQATLEDLTVDLARGRGSFRYRVLSADLGQLGWVLPELQAPPGETPPLWLPTAGQGSLAGAFRFGGPEGARTELALDLDAVRSSGLTADRVDGSLVVTEEAVEGLRLQLQRGRGALLVTGRVPFEGTMSLALDAELWPLAEARAFLPLELPLAGPVSGRLLLRGTEAALSGDLDATVAPAEVWGQPVEQVRARLAFEPAAVEVEEVLVAAATGEVRAGGRFDPGGEGPLELSLEGRGLDLGAAPFAGLLGGRLVGALDLEGRLTGTLARPAGELSANGRDLTLAGRSLPAASLVARWEGRKFSASGSLLGLVGLDGGGTLDAESADLRFAVEVPDLSVLAQAGGVDLPGLTGSARGTLVAEGPLDALEAVARLDPVELAYAEHRLRNMEPVELRLAGGRLGLESFYLGDPGAAEAEVFVAGGVALSSEAPLDLRLQATLPAAWLEPWLPGARLAGTLNALGRVGGTLARPALDGQADLAQGEILVEGFPHSLEQVRAVVLVYPDQLVLDGLEARLGGGQVRAAGRLPLGAAPGAPDYRLQLSARDLRLRYPEGWALEGDAELQLLPTAGGRLLRGRVELSRAYYLEDIRISLFQLLAGFLRRQRLQVATTAPELTGTELSIALSAPGALRVKNNVADFEADAELMVRGNLARPVVVGQVEAEPGGTLLYGEGEYEIERGLLTFARANRIDPVVDLVARSRIREYEITLNLSGTLERLNATFSSDPPLPDLEVLALLATGERLEGGGELTAAGATTPGGEGGAQLFLYGHATSAIGSRVKTLFGLDKFRIDPTASATGSVTGARFLVGKQISRDLFVTYEEAVSEPRRVVRAEWQVGPGLVVVLTYTDEAPDRGNAVAVDLQWERRF